jgi:hypothetical protein
LGVRFESKKLILFRDFNNSELVFPRPLLYDFPFQGNSFSLIYIEKAFPLFNDFIIQLYRNECKEYSSYLRKFSYENKWVGKKKTDIWQLSDRNYYFGNRRWNFDPMLPDSSKLKCNSLLEIREEMESWENSGSNQFDYILLDSVLNNSLENTLMKHIIIKISRGDNIDNYYKDFYRYFYNSDYINKYTLNYKGYEKYEPINFIDIDYNSILDVYIFLSQNLLVIDLVLGFFYSVYLFINYYL